jgi:hypothetical protein
MVERKGERFLENFWKWFAQGTEPKQQSTGLRERNITPCVPSSLSEALFVWKMTVHIMWVLLPRKCNYVLIKSRFIARQWAMKLSSPGVVVNSQPCCPGRLSLVQQSWLPAQGRKLNTADLQGLLRATLFVYPVNYKHQPPIKTPIQLIKSQIQN